MKRAIVILCVLGLAAAIGYLLGTEQGRQQRDQALARMKGEGAPIDELDDAPVTDISDAAANGADQAEVASI